MFDLVWHDKAVEDYEYWRRRDPDTVVRIDRLLEAIRADPFGGIGKPEPLKYRLGGLWSRRISENHRILYEVVGNAVEICRCRGHYK
jgi:toxin YoeB